MANAELVVALVALVVSLIALTITATQLLADILATAEGRRKTSETVMGPFGRLTEKALMWKDLRFQIHYVSPHLVLRDPKRLEYSRSTRPNLQLKKDKNLHFESFYSLKDSQIAPYVDLQGRDLDQGWQDLLSAVRDSTFVAHGQSDYIGDAPYIGLRRRAWDALPDDVGRAIATTELFDILVIARRLGAVWQPWDSLSDGLRAEGNGHVFISTEIRGLGLALSYQFTGAMKETIKMNTAATNSDFRTSRTSRVWTREANKLMFGICPGSDDFDLVDFVIRTREDLTTVWNDGEYLDIPASDKDNNWADLFSRKHGVTLRHATNDIIALSCPMIRPSNVQRRSSVMGRVLLPFAANFENMFQGYDVERDHRGREIFMNRLDEELKHYTSQVLSKISEIARTLVRPAGHAESLSVSDLSVYLDRACDGYDETTKYFKSIERKLAGITEKTSDEHSDDDATQEKKKKSQKFYQHLMSAHLSMSPLVHGTATRNFSKGLDREKGNVKRARRRIRCEQVHLLFDSIDHFQDFMASKGYKDRNLVKEAWIVLFFRGMCWSLCHTADELGTFLPTEYYGSQMPIYLI